METNSDHKVSFKISSRVTVDKTRAVIGGRRKKVLVRKVGMHNIISTLSVPADTGFTMKYPTTNKLTGRCFF